jgi:hypothetical protein
VSAVSIEEIVSLIARRDSISMEEARDVVRKCQSELDMIVSAGGSLDGAEECVAYWLNLEPDYLPSLLDC